MAANVQQASGGGGGTIPFRYGSRMRIQRVGFIPFAENTQAAPLELPRVGFLAAVVLEWRGTISGTDVAAGPRGPWALVRRLRLGLNLGAVNIYDTTGYGNYLINLLNGRDYSKHPLYNATSRWYYFIPVAANLGENSTTGLVLLQDPEVRATVEVTWGALADAFNGTDLSAAAGSGLDVYYVYFEVPDLRRVSAPPLVLHRVLEDSQPITQTGDNAYLVPRQGILLQLAHHLTLNGAFSSAWDRAAIRLNRTDTIMEVIPGVHYALDLQGRNAQISPITPTHVIFHDLFRAMGELDRGDLRDALDTEAVTTTESVVTVSQSATLGANNNFLGAIRRILQPIRV